ncbi:MAG: carbohydrate porin [bacterium]
MNKVIVFVFFLVLGASIKAQERGSEKIVPIKYQGSYVIDLVNNINGGKKTGFSYLGRVNLRLSFETQSANLWNNGEFLVNIINTHGGTPTDKLVGDFQGVSNIEAGNYTYFYELWYKHTVGDFAFCVGVQDMAADFAVSDNAALFLNGSFGIHSTISSNVTSPIFPLTGLGAQVQWQVSPLLLIKAAGYDGLPDDFNKNPYNLKWDIKSNDGILSVVEFDYFSNLIDSLPGTYKLGFYYHNHLLNEDEDDLNYMNNYGYYFVVDRVIFENLNGSKLTFFAQLGFGPTSKNENNLYAGTGISYTGLINNRENDILGFAVAFAEFKNKNISETTIEVSYLAQITDNVFIQPDIQYIINPAGTDLDLNNSLVGIVRLGLSL